MKKFIILAMISVLLVGCSDKPKVKPHYEVREVRVVGVTEYHVVWVSNLFTATRKTSKYKTFEEANFKYEELVNPKKYNKTLRGNENDGTN